MLIDLEEANIFAGEGVVAAGSAEGIRAALKFAEALGTGIWTYGRLPVRLKKQFNERSDMLFCLRGETSCSITKLWLQSDRRHGAKITNEYVIVARNNAEWLMSNMTTMTNIKTITRLISLQSCGSCNG